MALYSMIGGVQTIPQEPQIERRNVATQRPMNSHSSSKAEQAQPEPLCLRECSSNQGLPLQLYWQLWHTSILHHSQRKGLPDNPHKCPGSHGGRGSEGVGLPMMSVLGESVPLCPFHQADQELLWGSSGLQNKGKREGFTDLRI